jgi:hypothetical protein
MCQLASSLSPANKNFRALSHITMDDLDYVFNDVLAIASKGQSAQFVFNEVGHEATHRSASGGYSLKKDGATGIFSQGTLNGGDLSIADSMIDQLRVETSFSIERRITTCSIASLFRPAVVISARMWVCSFVSFWSPWMECNMTGSGVMVESSKARMWAAAETLQSSFNSSVAPSIMWRCYEGRVLY